MSRESFRQFGWFYFLMAFIAIRILIYAIQKLASMVGL